MLCSERLMHQLDRMADTAWIHSTAGVCKCETRQISDLSPSREWFLITELSFSRILTLSFFPKSLLSGWKKMTFLFLLCQICLRWYWILTTCFFLDTQSYAGSTIEELCVCFCLLRPCYSRFPVTCTQCVTITSLTDSLHFIFPISSYPITTWQGGSLFQTE